MEWIKRKKELMEKLFKRLPEVKLNMEDTALLVIDMQYMDASRHHGMGAKAKELGLEDELDYYFTRVEKTIIPSIQKLLKLFRQNGGEILYARIESLTQMAETEVYRIKSLVSGLIRILRKEKSWNH